MLLGERIGNADLFHAAVADALHGRSRKQTVRGNGVHLRGAFLLEERGSLAQRPPGVNHIVHNDANDVLHVTDYLHGVHFVGLQAAFQDRHDVSRAHLVSHTVRAAHTARIGGHNHELLRGEVVLAKVQNNFVLREQVVHRGLVKEALNLTTVEIDRHHSTGTHGLHQLCHGGSRDGHPGLHLPVLTTVAVVRANCRNSLGRRETERVDEKK
mmetsp:Transcript_6850/g.19381  ORF Transcript_6850/g.19381 Transcript_6850/m.19381 type:complete len:212 (-) Transcript_6850:361-996(-)